MTIISGVLIGPNGVPRAGVTITLIAEKNSSAVLRQAPSVSMTSGSGEYTLNVKVGKHKVIITAPGRPPELAGSITVYSDSPNGSLNDFLLAPDESELMPAVIQTVTELSQLAQKSATSTASDAERAEQAAKKAEVVGDNQFTFTSLSGGLAGTTSGQTFRIGQGVGKGFRYYLNNAGSALEVASSVGEDAIKALSDVVPQVASYSGITSISSDASGRVAARMLDDGTTNLAALLLGNQVSFTGKRNSVQFSKRGTGEVLGELFDNGSFQIGQTLTYYADMPGIAQIWCDRLGQVNRIVYDNGDIKEASSSVKSTLVNGGSLAVEQDGNIAVVTVGGDYQTLTTDGFNASPQSLIATDGSEFIRFASREGNSAGGLHINRITADGLNRIRQGNGTFFHGVITGQSLSVGGATITQPAVTTTPQYPYGCVCFNGGTAFDSNYTASTLDASDLLYLVPAAENFGKRGGQESDCTGASERIFEKSGLTSMVTATGASGILLANISAGTASFAATTLMMRRAYEVSRSLGMTYAPYLMFIHGNADAVAGTSAEAYKGMVKSLRESYQAYLRTLMGDRTFVLKVFIQQFSNASVQAGPTAADVNLVIGNAQYELCRDDENFIMTGTQYARPYVDKDHLSNYGYRTDGEVFGNAVAEYLNTGKELALRPGNITQSDAEVTVPLLGGVGKAVIDTVRVTDPGNYGFRLTGATITGVTLDENNVVHIAKTGTATGVSYAYVGNRSTNPGPKTGSRGCIHDSTSETSRISKLPLYNDLLAFYQAL